MASDSTDSTRAAEALDGREAEDPLGKPTRRWFHRLPALLAVVVSLLMFPSVLPWMVAIWLVVHTVQVVRGRPGWVPLAICLVILVVKMVPRTPVLILFGVMLVGMVLYRCRPTLFAKKSGKRPNWISPVVAWAGWFAFLVHWHDIETCRQPMPLVPGRSVVCIGDSLTDGMWPDEGYPEPLKSMIDMPVVNLGFSGISTAQGLGQMERVLSHNPQVVIIVLGGHDFLKGYGRSATKRNLVEMIRQSRNAGADVVLMEIPRGFMFDPFASLEREIAYQHDVQLVSDTWLRQIVLLSPIAPPGKWFPSIQLSDDGIHSNARGSKAIAVRVANAIQAMYRP
jgi:lysophospholipase L1-like esterase